MSFYILAILALYYSCILEEVKGCTCRKHLIEDLPEADEYQLNEAVTWQMRQSPGGRLGDDVSMTSSQCYYKKESTSSFWGLEERRPQLGIRRELRAGIEPRHSPALDSAYRVLAH